MIFLIENQIVVLIRLFVDPSETVRGKHTFHNAYFDALSTSRMILYAIAAMVNETRVREKWLRSTTTEVMSVEVRSMVLQSGSAGVEKM